MVFSAMNKSLDFLLHFFVDEIYRQKIIALRGADGKKWLDSLPLLLKKYEELWGITCDDPFLLSYNYVAPAKMQDNADVVIKINLPTQEPNYEAKSLQLFAGNGAIRLLKENTADNVMLLEKAVPGERLSDKTSEEQVSIFAEVVGQLHNQRSGDISIFPTLDLWAKDFASYREKFSLSSGPIPQKLFEKTEAIFTQYPKENRQMILLHGDLHAANILSSERGWLAIDPKGIIGEKEFEVGVFLRNPYGEFPHETNYKKFITNRIAQCAELTGFDKKRITDWAFATAVNAMVWFLKDTEMLRKEYLADAELLDSISF